MKVEYCKRCGSPIPRERVSNFCSDQCNLMPQEINDREARLIKQAIKQNNEGLIYKIKKLEKKIIEGEQSAINYQNNGFNNALDEIIKLLTI